MNEEIYMDNASTTQPDIEVLEYMMGYLSDMWYNPNSIYSKGKQVRNKLEECRKYMAEFVNCKPNEVIFTSCASESNSLAIQGFIKQCWYDGVKPTIISTDIEHNSILLQMNEYDFVDYHILEVDYNGMIKECELKGLLDDTDFTQTRVLCSIQLANNEIGVIQNIKSLSELIHSYGGIIHTDATQAISHIPIDVQVLGIDMISGGSHKLNAPRGCGALYIKEGIELKPIIYGTQENGLRGGTENFAGILGMAKSIMIRSEREKTLDIRMSLTKKRDYFISELQSRFSCKLNGDRINRLPNNINVIFPNIIAENLLLNLDMLGVYCSTGSACDSKSLKPSHVLKAIGLTDEEANSSIRFTLRDYTTKEDIDMVLEKIDKALKMMNMEEA